MGHELSMKDGRRINSYRLKGHDYSQPGFYFLTICTSDRKNLFGEIADCQMRLNMAGKFAERCWQEIPKHFSTVGLDEFVIMPNHVHGLIIINHENTTPVEVQHTSTPVEVQYAPTPVEVQYIEPLRNVNFQRNVKPKQKAGYQHVIPGSVGAIIRCFKSAVTRCFHENTQIKTVWQRNFYDHIVRDESELNRIRLYIQQNPSKWLSDRQNKNRLKIVRETESIYQNEIWMI